MHGLGRQPAADPTVVATAFQQQRLYVFSKREPADYDDAAVGRSVPASCSEAALWVLSSHVCVVIHPCLRGSGRNSSGTSPSVLDLLCSRPAAGHPDLMALTQ